MDFFFVFFCLKNKKISPKKKKKKCYSLSFANWGDKSSTRALQSSPFQNPGGVPWAWHSSTRSSSSRTVFPLSNIGWSKNPKIWKNLKKSQKITFFQKIWKFWKYFFFAEKKKNAILLVLPNEEISLRPELSSPPRFRIQGG